MFSYLVSVILCHVQNGQSFHTLCQLSFAMFKMLKVSNSCVSHPVPCSKWSVSIPCVSHPLPCSKWSKFPYLVSANFCFVQNDQSFHTLCRLSFALFKMVKIHLVGFYSFVPHLLFSFLSSASCPSSFDATTLSWKIYGMGCYVLNLRKTKLRRFSPYGHYLL